MLVEVYTDGSATTGDLPGGWAFVVCVNGVKVCDGSGSLCKATNNVAEVTAAIRGLEHVLTADVPGLLGSDVRSESKEDDGRPDVVLISDSQLTLKWATGEYRCKKWHLIPHVIQLRKLMQRLGATTRWVKGHNGDEHNETCDTLAKAAREKEEQSQKANSSGGKAP